MPKPNFSFVMFMILEKKFTIQHLLFKFNQNFNSSNAKKLSKKSNINSNFDQSIKFEGFLPNHLFRRKFTFGLQTISRKRML